MTTHRIATFSIGGGSAKYGAVIEGGIVDLSARFGKDFPTLREAAAAGSLMRLVEDAARRSPDHALDSITWLPPIPAPETVSIKASTPNCVSAPLTVNVRDAVISRRWP